MTAVCDKRGVVLLVRAVGERNRVRRMVYAFKAYIQGVHLTNMRFVCGGNLAALLAASWLLWHVHACAHVFAATLSQGLSSRQPV
jgi:hypothetical protein